MDYTNLVLGLMAFTGLLCVVDVIFLKKKRTPMVSPPVFIGWSYYLCPRLGVVYLFLALNFSLFLVLMTFGTGLIFLTQKFFPPKPLAPGASHKSFWVELGQDFFPVLLVVLIFRSFLFEPFRIPSGSLEPTLNVGDFVLVNKFAYGLKWPVLEQKFMSIGEPKRGQIAVFRWPPNPDFDFIKRVVGVPGDTIEYKNKVFYINGQEMPQKFIKHTIDESSGHPVKQYQENLDGVKHFIYVRDEAPAQDFKIIVPEGQYFMVGDNRDDSADSRYWGFVDDAHLRGRALLVWMSWNNQTTSVRTGNIGKFI